MTQPRIDDIDADDLHIHVEEVGARWVVTWTGRSNARDPAKLLRSWVERLLQTAHAGGQTVEMHFEKLELFNSSTIAALIQMINAARDLGVTMQVHYDASLRWQSLSFEALKRALRPFEGPATPGGARIEFVHARR